MLKPRNIITILLLAFVAGSVAFLLFKETTPHAESSVQSTMTRTDQVVATYFHGRARCIACQHLQLYAEEALTSGFPRELADGRLVWRTVDISQPQNRHFVADYQLRYQSVIMEQMNGSQVQRWRNLDQIWHKVRDREDYITYVQREVGRFLTGE